MSYRIPFNKPFVIGRDGQVVARIGPRTKPDAPEVIRILEAELAKKTAVASAAH